MMLNFYDDLESGKLDSISAAAVDLSFPICKMVVVVKEILQVS